jgi:hypothetical protein
VLAAQAQDIAAFAMDLLDMGGAVSDPELAPLKAAFQDSVLSTPGSRIAAGTDEILKNIIAERVLGTAGRRPRGQGPGVQGPADGEALMKGRVAVLKTYGGEFELREYPVPDVEPGAILVKLTRAGICGSDLHIWRGEMKRSTARCRKTSRSATRCAGASSGSARG